MRKPMIVVVGALAVIAIGAIAFFGGGLLGKSAKNLNGGGVTPSSTGQPETGQSDVSVPGSAPDIRGTVKAVEGDKILIARVKDDPLAGFTEEEREARKQEMLKLSLEERQALRQQELEGLETEDVSITIPVGTPVVKVTAGQGQGPNNAGEQASLSDIRAGLSLAIWTEDAKTDSATARYVVIEGAQQ